MIFTTKNIQDINLKKYKRLITIGCSFTNYLWETWADLLAYEMPQAEYINVGQSGAGQIYMVAQLNQAMNKLNLSQDDLVCIMWSTYYRDDRYLDNGWVTPGNIYTQNVYPMDYVMKFYTPRGMAIRDLALIDTTSRMLENVNFDVLMTMSMPLTKHEAEGSHQQFLNENMEDVYMLYNNIDKNMLPSIFHSPVLPNGFEHTFKFEWNGELFHDHHPTTTKYCEYLLYLGIPISEECQQHAKECDVRSSKIKNREHFSKSIQASTRFL